MNNLDFRMQTLLDSARQDGEHFEALKIHVARVYEMIGALELTMDDLVELESAIYSALESAIHVQAKPVEIF